MLSSVLDIMKQIFYLCMHLEVELAVHLISYNLSVVLRNTFSFKSVFPLSNTVAHQ